jgi:Kdo2-lipid IVA lauroyltransferase/acyltransferase
MSKRHTLKTVPRYIMEYLMTRLILFAMGLLPRSISIAAGCTIGRIAYFIGGKLRRTGERNLELAFPDMERNQRSLLLRKCYTNLGRSLGELSQLPHMTAEQLCNIVEYDGFENLKAAQSAGNGVIFLTSHMGAWELSSLAHSAYGHTMSFVVRRLDNPYMEKFVDRIRTKFGNQTIDKKGSARKLLKILREGGSIGILADLNTQPHEGVFVPFFNHMACATTGVAVLALRTNAAVIPAFIYWDQKRKRYILKFDPILNLIRTGNEALDIEANTARFTLAIENHIRTHPDQWLWIHRRWKTRPKGEPDLYSKHWDTSSVAAIRTSGDGIRA